MANVESLVNKILNDAKEQENEILSKAEIEKNKIIEIKINEAKIKQKEIIEKAEEEAKLRKDRIISNANLKVRNDKLKAKQKIIKDVFELSIEKLNNLSKDEFLNYIKNQILSLDISGKYNLIINSKQIEFIDDDFIEGLNKSLKDKKINAQILLSNESLKDEYGFILEQNGIQINNTFKALVDSIKDDLEYEIASILFN